LKVASSERSGDDASPVDAPQPTMWKLNSCFEARPEYGPSARSRPSHDADAREHLRHRLHDLLVVDVAPAGRGS
jgi:hypothetical protein